VHVAALSKKKYGFDDEDEKMKLRSCREAACNVNALDSSNMSDVAPKRLDGKPALVVSEIQQRCQSVYLVKK
jgi:hypothetical protein